MGLIDRLRSDVRQAWGDSWPLMATVALMLPSLGVALLGLLVRPARDHGRSGVAQAGQVCASRPSSTPAASPGCSATSRSGHG